jgi:hypothetical protein
MRWSIRRQTRAKQRTNPPLPAPPRASPKRITIVSCDPATLARDLAGLSGYKIERMALVDLFPQTFHIEIVAMLRR